MQMPFSLSKRSPGANAETMRFLAVFHALCTVLFVAACGSVHAPAPTGVQSGGRGYPTVLPVLDDDELERRTAEVEAKTPGWMVILDPLGFLSSATCVACGRSKPEDI